MSSHNPNSRRWPTHGQYHLGAGTSFELGYDDRGAHLPDGRNGQMYTGNATHYRPMYNNTQYMQQSDPARGRTSEGHYFPNTSQYPATHCAPLTQMPLSGPQPSQTSNYSHPQLSTNHTTYNVPGNPTPLSSSHTPHAQYYNNNSSASAMSYGTQTYFRVPYPNSINGAITSSIPPSTTHSQPPYSGSHMVTVHIPEYEPPPQYPNQELRICPQTGQEGPKQNPACRECRRRKVRCEPSADNGTKCKRCRKHATECLFDKSRRGSNNKRN